MTTLAPTGQALDDNINMRKCTFAALSEWAAAAACNRETTSLGWEETKGMKKKDFSCEAGSDWNDSFESMTLNADGSCGGYRTSNSGRDSSSQERYSGVWFLNEQGLVECWLFQDGGYCNATNYIKADRSDGVELVVRPAWYKIESEGEALVRMCKNSLETEDEGQFSAPYSEEPSRAVLRSRK